MKEYIIIYINSKLNEDTMLVEASNLKEAINTFDKYTKGDYIDIIDVID